MTDITSTSSSTQTQVASAVRFVQYEGEHQLSGMRELISGDLSEPYSIYTYRYFLHKWPKHCYLAIDQQGKCVGTVVCRLDYHRNTLPFDYQTFESDSDSEEFDEGIQVRYVDGLVVPNSLLRGYIAMLVVATPYRKFGIGSELVTMAIDSMRQEKANEIVLETEVSNHGAIALYQRLGFIKDKRLHRYYLNGVDAFRLKLRLPHPEPSRPE
ncbi:n-terminal acetyltransferase c complex catalytic subunit mak3 [Dimargaris cristalligena]|nr:n-terminal acetyltransferase c complex catalytic subunit mak3 [Dimargaris cristalligena]